MTNPYHIIERTSSVNVHRIREEAYFRHGSSSLRLTHVDGQEYWGQDLAEGEQHALRFACAFFTFSASEAEDRVNDVLEAASQPAPVVNEYELHYAGTIDSEESMAVTLKDGRSIVMESIVYDKAPEEKRDDPLYWLARWESGEFASYATNEEEEGNKPYCWVNIPGRRGNFDRPEREGEYLNYI